MQRCLSQPELASYVRELYISEQNGYFYPKRSLFDDGDETHGLDSFRSRMLAHGLKDDSKNGQCYNSIAMMAVVLCTNVEKIVVESTAVIPWVLPDELLEDCATLLRSSTSTPSHVPLAHLHTLAIRAPSQADQGPKPDRTALAGFWWFENLVRLPKLTFVELVNGHDILGLFPESLDGLEFSLRSLMIPNYSVGSEAQSFRRALKACPLLKYLDLTSQLGFHDDDLSTWSEIGEVLSQYGSSFCKFRYDNVYHATTPGLLDVHSMRQLQYLAVPVDALVALHSFYGAFE